MEKAFLIIGIVCICLLVLVIVGSFLLNKKKVKLKNTVLGTGSINYREFEKNWSGSSGKKGFNTGYKYNSCCGCYIITIYSHKIVDDNYLNYEKVFVGSAPNVFLKIHNHFTGKGNPEIGTACKKGKYVYVSVIPCEKEQLAKTEKQLATVFAETKFKNPFSKNK